MGQHGLHEGVFDPRFVHSHIWHDDAETARIETTLRELGAPPQCVTWGSDLDGRAVTLRQALDDFAANRLHYEAVIVCRPRRLAYYQSHNALGLILVHPG